MPASKPGHPPVDVFYTPDWLADELVSLMPRQLEGRVLDPSVGSGSLLSAVERRFGKNVPLLGIDVDKRAVREVLAENPSWIVSHANLLSPASRRASGAWRAAQTDLSSVVINPPFSYRGNGGVQTAYAGFSGLVAPAMSFLVEVLRTLRPKDGIFSILPDGAIDAEKHVALWGQIKRFYTVSRPKRINPATFSGARVSTSLVQLVPGCTPTAATCIDEPRSQRIEGCTCVEVIRGRVQVHQMRGVEPVDPAPFIHTTTLVRPLQHWLASGALADMAPLVLITRVGRWSMPTVLDVGRAVLSDCVIALRPRARTQVEQLRDSVAQSTAEFRALYRGTGAKYLTLASVVELLTDLGWHPHVVKASSAATECCCGASQEDACLGIRLGTRNQS